MYVLIVFSFLLHYPDADAQGISCNVCSYTSNHSHQQLVCNWPWRYMLWFSTQQWGKRWSAHDTYLFNITQIIVNLTLLIIAMTHSTRGVHVA